jgi:hypothetical protein
VLLESFQAEDSCSGTWVRHLTLVARRASQQVVFHIVLGAFHIDLLLSCEFRADSIKHRGTGRKIPG